MAGEWPRTTLRDEVDLLTGFPFKSECYTESPDGIRLLRGDNIIQGSLRWDGVKRWPSVDENEYEKYQLQYRDVVLAMDRPWIEAGLKYAAISKADLPCFLVQRTTRMRGGARLDTEFLRYIIGSREFTQHILAVQTGTAVPHISPTQIKEFSFFLPPLPTQRAIAHVLGTLDDLIELNRETNELLEEMARALFKSWFVDFDPVRAKLEGRQPAGMDAATAALFPNHFQDSELGQIPKGWSVGKVSEFVSLGRVAVNPGNYPSEVFDHYSLPAFDDGRSPKTETGSTIMSNKFLVEPDSVLLSKLNPHIPRVWFPDLDDKRRSVCSTEFMVARASAGVSREYMYSLFTNSYFASIYGTLVSGTTGSHQRISPDSFIAMQIVAPPIPLVKAFTDLVRPMFETIHSNLRESRDLATLRDTLLPKLLSGEVSVTQT